MSILNNMICNGTLLLAWVVVAFSKYTPVQMKRLGAVMCVVTVLNAVFYAPHDRYAFQYLAWLSVVLLQVGRVMYRRR